VVDVYVSVFTRRYAYVQHPALLTVDTDGACAAGSEVRSRAWSIAATTKVPPVKRLREQVNSAPLAGKRP
jgi:hypothetical protein